MGLFKRLFGLESNSERLARELFSPAAEHRRAREVERSNDAIGAAITNPEVQTAIAEAGLHEQHVADLYRRIEMDGGPKLAALAITDTEILRWFADNGGREGKLTFGQSLQLLALVKERYH